MRASYILALGALAATTTAVELSNPKERFFEAYDQTEQIVSRTLEDLQSLLASDEQSWGIMSSN